MRPGTKPGLVYDWPTRVFHWVFSGLFVAAFVIAKTSDDESPFFAFHMLAGLTLGSVVLLRLIWGVLGTRHARFSDFALAPRALVAYFKGVLTGDKTRWAGHNPASSHAALVMMGLGLSLAVSGFLMASGGIRAKETIEDVHELLANAFLITAALHVAGIAVHTLRHRELIGLSMVSGRKEGVPDEQAIASSRPAFGILFLAVAISIGVSLYRNYDAASGTLTVFGSSLQLAEIED